MAEIRTSIPSNRRKPGVTVEFNTKSAAKGLTPNARHIAAIGCRLASSPSVVEKPYQVFSEKDGDELFGAGSEVAIMIRAFFAVANKIRLQPFIWAVGINENGAGTQATKLFTVTGPATASGDLEVRIAGRTIRAAVVNGDSANTIAASLKAAIDAYQNTEPLIATAGVNTNVVTMTARHKGVNGNDLKIEVVSAPLGVTVAVSVGVTATGSYDITNALDSLGQIRTYNGVAIANHLAADVADAKAWLATVGDPSVKRWSSCFIGESGSIATATALASGSNDMGVVITDYENARNLPCEIAAQRCIAEWAIEDPAANFDGFELPLYPVDSPDAFLNSEIETMLAAGVTPLVPNEQGTGSKIVRSVTTKTTENSVPFEPLLDFSNVKALYFMGTQIDQRLTRDFQGLDAKMTVDIEARVEDAVYEVLDACADLQVCKPIEPLKHLIKFEADAIVPTRGNVAWPAAPILSLHQLANVGNLQVG